MQAQVHCSFCGKAATEVRYIVAESRSTAICNECALLTIDVLLEHLDPNVAELLERHSYLLNLENPYVVVRDIHIDSVLQTVALLLLGFLPMFLANTASKIPVEVRMDLLPSRIRLAIRTTQADRAAVQDCVTLYGDILSGERSIDEVPMTAAAREEFLRVKSIHETYAGQWIRAPTDGRSVSLMQQLGWVLTEDWDDKIGNG
jgi:hypothetical protein